MVIFLLSYTLLEKSTVIIILVTLCFKTRRLSFYVVQVVRELRRLSASVSEVQD